MLHLKVHPPIVFVTVAGLIAVFDGFSFTSESFLLFMGTMVALSSLVMALIALTSFKSFKTTIHPLEPSKTTTLVTHGIYRYSRNPMYLSLALLLFSWGCFLGAWLTPIGVGIFIVYIETFQIRPEEHALRLKFGRDYEEYCRKVRRWV